MNVPQHLGRWLALAACCACTNAGKPGDDARDSDSMHDSDAHTDVDTVPPDPHAPSPPVVRVVPDDAYEGRDDLRCEVVSGGVDPDGDPLTWRFAWAYTGLALADASAVSADHLAADGALPGDTIPAADVIPGRWRCTPTVSDGTHTVTGASDAQDVRVRGPLLLAMGRTCVADPTGGLACWGPSWRHEPPPKVKLATAVGDYGYACGIRDDDQTLACWDFPSGTAYVGDPTPAGRFRELTMRNGVAMAIGEDGRVTSWQQGAPTTQVKRWATPPDVPLHGLVQRYWTACALDATDHAHCWSPTRTPVVDTPDDALEQVALLGNGNSGDGLRAYGLRLDGTLVTWPDTPDAVAPPAGKFDQVVAGYSAACALSLARGGEVWCWLEGAFFYGDAGQVPPRLVATGWVTIDMAYDMVCGQLEDGHHVCVRVDPDPSRCANSAMSFPTERVSELAVHGSLCGLDASGVATCFGGVPSPPPVPLTELTVGTVTSCAACGVRQDDGLPFCWAQDVTDGRLARVPHEPLHDIAFSGAVACALNVDDRAVCWHETGAGVPAKWAAPPDVPLASLVAGQGMFCGLEPDGTAHCWGTACVLSPGWQSTCGPTTAGPAEGQRFQGELVDGQQQICGLLVDGEVACWQSVFAPGSTHPPATPPPGPFTSILIGGDSACGRRPDGTFTCWSNGWAVWRADATPPPGVRVDTVRGHWGGFCGLDDEDRVFCWGGETRGPIPL